ncbi:MAG: DUF3301 domain-containing protein [Gammaproteobacteria bacterium]|nr:DUF3301 domain-containing protein [Gammaproteobacteria bacterium]
MKELLLIGFISFLFWLWRNSMLSRELAFKISKKACRDLDVQLLDDTVSLSKLKLCRNERGSMSLCRLYTFEFTQTGEARYIGKIYLKGLVVMDVILDIHNDF